MAAHFERLAAYCDEHRCWLELSAFAAAAGRPGRLGTLRVRRHADDVLVADQQVKDGQVEQAAKALLAAMKRAA